MTPVRGKFAKENTLLNSDNITLGGGSTYHAAYNFIGAASQMTIHGQRNVLLSTSLNSGDDPYIGDDGTVINSTGWKIQGDHNTFIDTQNCTSEGDENIALASQNIDFNTTHKNAALNSTGTNFGSDSNYTGLNTQENTAINVTNGNINGDDNVLLGGFNNDVRGANNTVLGGKELNINDSSTNTVVGGKNNTITSTAIDNILLGSQSTSVSGDNNLLAGGKNNDIRSSAVDNVILGSTTSTVLGDNNVVAGSSNTVGTNVKYTAIFGAQHNIDPTSSSQRNFVVGYQHEYTTTGNNSFIGGTKGTIAQSNSFGFGKGIKLAHGNMGAFGKFNDSTANDGASSLFTVGCGFNATSGVKNALNIVTQTGNSAIVYMDEIVAKNYADDSAAATAGIGIGGLYHSNGFLKVRIGGSVTTTTTTTTTTRSTNEEELEEQR